MIEAQRSALPIAIVLSILISIIPAQGQLLRPSVEAKSVAASKAADSGAGRSQSQTQSPANRPISISDAVSIFLKQNFQLIAARYDIDTAEAEKLTAR